MLEPWLAEHPEDLGAHALYIEVRVHDDQKGCDIMHRQKPKAAEADQYIASGFYQKAAELHGLKNACCSFSMERKGVHFVLTWA